MSSSGTPDVRDALVEAATRLRHDLGKYVTLQQRWLPPDATLEARAEALRRDLLETRRGPDGAVGALELWERLRRPFVEEIRVDHARAHPILDALERDMRELARVIETLGGEGIREAVVRRGEAATRRVSDGCKALVRAIREDDSDG